MTIAELHGKISRTGSNLHDQLEDLLTSDVFAACKYVRPQSLLLPFLRTAISISGDFLNAQIPEIVGSVEYKFWPMLNHCEPDLLVCFGGLEDYYSLILIESKYMSAKSSGPLDESELYLSSAPADQLAREYVDLQSAHERFGVSKDAVRFRSIVYITAHRIMPKTSIQESLLEIKHFLENSEPINLYWTNWFNLYPILRRKDNLLDWEEPIIDDLLHLLVRKQLVAFSGFTLPNETPEISSRNIYESRFKSRLLLYQYDVKPLPSLIDTSFYQSGQIIRSYHWKVSATKVTKNFYTQKGIK